MKNVIDVVVIQDNKIVVDSAVRRDEPDSIVCIYLSSRFGNCAVALKGFRRFGS